MRSAVILSVMVALCLPGAFAQEVSRWRSAVVALSEDPELRRDFETRLVERARLNNYDAVTSFDIEPDVRGIDDRGFVDELREHGFQSVLMLRPAAVGEGSSIDSVRASIDAGVFERIREFAGEVSQSGPDDLIAVVHMAIYTIDDDGAHLISGGAVWLDEPNPSRAEGIERLQNLILANVDGVRPALREHLGLPPLQR